MREITESTLYRWKRRCAGFDVSGSRELTQLRDEKRKLKRLVADLMLDQQILREAPGKKRSAWLIDGWWWAGREAFQVSQ